jgi:hypothetical protein
MVLHHKENDGSSLRCYCTTVERQSSPNYFDSGHALFTNALTFEQWRRQVTLAKAAHDRHDALALHFWSSR